MKKAFFVFLKLKITIYGLFFDKLDGANVKLENAKETLGDIFFNKLMQIEPAVMLDHSIFGYLQRCSLINEILSEHNYFLRFYERRNKFRYQLRQKLKTKNEMRKELSACAIQKFNGYELLRNHLNNGERQDFIPIDIVYEPTLDTTKPIFCFFAPSISLGSLGGGKRYISHTGARQCHYCNNYFIKSPEKMQKHLSVCAGNAGFTFSFDNGKIIGYQDHYKNLGDVPFSVYYDFETTTGSVVFFDAKMYVISYCIVIAFHPGLKFPRLIIYRSYDQSTEKSTSLSHFEAIEHNFFINKKNCNMTTLKQLQDAAFSVENREKKYSTSRNV